MRLKDPFVRRIIQHKAVSVLFRSSEESSRTEKPLSLLTSPAMEGSLPRAMLVPQSVLEKLPWGHVAGSPPVPVVQTEPMDGQSDIEELIKRAEAPLHAAQKSVQKAHPQQVVDRTSVKEMQRSALPVQPHRQVARQQPVEQRMETDHSIDADRVEERIQRAELPSQRKPGVVQQGAESTDLAQDWVRLQAIMRRHTELESVQADDVPDEPVQKTKPASPSLPHDGIARKPVIEEITGKPADSSKLQSATMQIGLPNATTPQPLEQLARLDESTQSTGEEALQMAGDDGSMPEGTAPVETSAPSALPEQAESQINLAEQADFRQAASKSEGEPAVRELHAEPTAVPVETKDVPGDNATEQAIPLEQVWSVQRLAPSMLQQGTEQPVQRAVPLEMDEESLSSSEKLRSLLENISVEQPTESHVELVTPRKPRPAAQMKPAAQPDRETSDISGTEPPAREESVFSDVSIPHPIEAQQGNRMDVQLKGSSQSVFSEPPGTPETVSGVSGTGGPEQVQTEIGPLPADLWTLLGAEPPVVQRSSAAGTQTHAAGDERVLPVGLPLSPDEQPAKASGFSSQPFAPVSLAAEMIQRQAEGAETASTTQTPEGGETQTDEKPESGAEVDTDELAKKVYAQLKRRLAVEWERLRKRF